MKTSLSIALLSCLGACFDNQVPVVTPEIDQQLSADLLNGRAALDCHVQCAGSWILREQEFRNANYVHNWHALGVGVMQVGYQSDLAYYYLGRAAQGQGAYEAALRYYGIATSISRGQNEAIKCEAGVNTCDGVNMPGILPVVIQMAQTDLTKQQAEAPPPPEPAPSVRSHPKRVASKPKPPTVIFDDPPPITR